jgi:hypothetical protein
MFLAVLVGTAMHIDSAGVIAPEHKISDKLPDQQAKVGMP